MSEFQEKVAQFKQNIQESGFTTEETLEDRNEPTIGSTIINDPMDNRDDGIDSDNKSDNKQPPVQKKKHTNTFKKRIDQLTYENRIKEAQTQDLMAKLQQKEQLLADTQYQLEQKDQHTSAYYENNLSIRENAILSELKAAKEEGEVDKEISLSQALAQVTAEKSTYGLYKSQLKNQNNQSNFNPEYSLENDYYPQQQLQNYNEDVYYGESQNEVLDSWLETNQWADPDSPQFSPRLRNEVDQFASELNEMLKYNGNAEAIGTPEYFSSLDTLMADRYSVKGSQTLEEPPRQSSYNNSTVAPVSRRGSSMADQYISKNPNSTRQSMSLTEDEYKIARNLQIRLPNGRMANSDEAVRRYAEAKRNSGAPNGSNKLIIE